MSFKEALADSVSADLKLLAYESETENSLKSALFNNKNAKNISLFIGPEGGFSDEEVSLAKADGFKTITLGPRILRTETAPIACVSAIMYELGDW